MPLKNDGIMVILSSPSGVGKTTLVKLLSKRKDFKISISHTTRKPRESEVPNKDYFFVNDIQFKRLIQNEEFLEYAKVFNHLYGTTRLDYKLITFFLLPPSKQILFERLSNREMKDKLIAEKRMKEFNRDVLHWINYDYVIINDNLEDCYKKIDSLINAELFNGPKDYDKHYIRKHIEKLTI